MNKSDLLNFLKSYSQLNDKNKRIVKFNIACMIAEQKIDKELADRLSKDRHISGYLKQLRIEIA